MSSVTLTFEETTIDRSIEGLSYRLDDGGMMVRFGEESTRAVGSTQPRFRGPWVTYTGGGVHAAGA